MRELTAENRDRKHRRQRYAALALVLVVSASTSAMDAGPSAGRQPGAHDARSLSFKATAYLHLVKAEGSQLSEVGRVYGALSGSMKADLKTGAVFTGSFTTSLSGGSIKGHGQAKPHGSGRYQSFSGWFVATGGTGRYVHASGRAGLYGVFDRRNDSVTVQTTGQISY